MEKKKEGMGSTIDQNLSFKNIMKDVALFGSSHMTWKDKKALEDKKVTALGGKAQKMHRLPLSVARVQMKKQKDREEKMLEQVTILGYEQLCSFDPLQRLVFSCIILAECDSWQIWWGWK
jgi:hypothetical protein